jgi:hypothetical protein
MNIFFEQGGYLFNKIIELNDKKPSHNRRWLGFFKTNGDSDIEIKEHWLNALDIYKYSFYTYNLIMALNIFLYIIGFRFYLI